MDAARPAFLLPFPVSDIFQECLYVPLIHLFFISLVIEQETGVIQRATTCLVSSPFLLYVIQIETKKLSGIFVEEIGETISS